MCVIKKKGRLDGVRDHVIGGIRKHVPFSTITRHVFTGLALSLLHWEMFSNSKDELSNAAWSCFNNNGRVLSPSMGLRRGLDNIAGSTTVSHTARFSGPRHGLLV